VTPPGLDVAVYVVMAEPPLLAGAVNATVAVVCPVLVAVPIVGALGAIAATDAVAFEFALTADTEFVAVTTHLIALPTSDAVNTYVLLVAPLIFTPALCH
jgi:hypothetical protein